MLINQYKKKLWSKHVTENSNALDLEKGVFTWNNPQQIAKSLLQSALKSKRRKSSPYRSSMSMLNFYINRAGRNLPEAQKEILKKAKKELQLLFKKNSSAS